MLGWLVVNEFLTSNKYSTLNDWLLEAAKKLDINLVQKTNAELMVGCLEDVLEKEETPDFVLFWDKDIRLAKALEQRGMRVFNSSLPIEICDDKSYTELVLRNAGIPMPKTILAPKTFDTVGYCDQQFLEVVIQKFGFPFVVKECFGSFGQQVYLCKDRKDLGDILSLTGAKPILFQEFIESSFGKDVRIQVVGEKVIASMYRYSENGDFRANISNGGKMKPYTPSEEEKDLAIKCCQIIGLDFAGVDLLFGENGKILVCEVNSNAHFKNISDCTHVDAAWHILDYIKKKLKGELA
ncbi:ribosomal protein S6 glutaminyl transferase [Lachnospiraceae bacterium KM106-2]|nr:ribosomal protein S6 glutaminyl transferase [Lachnospiraceae bacterium KM106-2]